jgi:hypothetical protein
MGSRASSAVAIPIRALAAPPESQRPFSRAKPTEKGLDDQHPRPA